MTLYEVDRASAGLLAAWASPDGRETTLAGPVGAVPKDVARKVSLLLAQASSALWEIYQRRRGSAVAVLDVSDALIQVAGGAIDNAPPMGLGDAETAIHRLGALIAAVDDAVLAATVRDQVRLDLDAIRAAARGEFGGRAGQAVPLDRGPAVAEQVVAADMVLAADPLTLSWPTDITPMSACVALARWLIAAVEVASTATGFRSDEVFSVADGLSPSGTELPAQVVARLQGGHDAADVVAELLRPGAPTVGPPVTGGQELLDQLLQGMASCTLVYLVAHMDEDLRSGDDDRHARSRDRILDQFRAEVRAAAGGGHGYA